MERDDRKQGPARRKIYASLFVAVVSIAMVVLSIVGSREYAYRPDIHPDKVPLA